MKCVSVNSKKIPLTYVCEFDEMKNAETEINK